MGGVHDALREHLGFHKSSEPCVGLLALRGFVKELYLNPKIT